MRNSRQRIKRTSFAIRSIKSCRSQSTRSKRLVALYSPTLSKEMAEGTILGISLGTRHVGIALLRKGKLFDWRLKTYKGIWSKSKLQKILNDIEEMLITQCITHVACKLPFKHQESNVQRILEGIQAQAEQYGISLHLYSIADLRKGIGSDISNKKDIAERLVIRYPELITSLTKEKGAKNAYYIKMLEAVAASSHCANRLIV